MNFFIDPFDAGGTPSFEEVLTDFTGTDAASFTTSTFARTAGEKFMVSIGSNDNLAHAQTPPSSLVQTGITWTFVTTVTRAGNTLAVYSGMATTTGNSALTVNFAGIILSMTWSITRLANIGSSVQSVAAQGQPGFGGWVDAPLAALSGGVVLTASAASGSSPFQAARPGYSLIAQVASNSPSAKLQVHHGVALPAGTQQNVGFADDLLIIGIELSI